MQTLSYIVTRNFWPPFGTSMQVDYCEALNPAGSFSTEIPGDELWKYLTSLHCGYEFFETIEDWFFRIPEAEKNVRIAQYMQFQMDRKEAEVQSVKRRPLIGICYEDHYDQRTRYEDRLEYMRS